MKKSRLRYVLQKMLSQLDSSNIPEELQVLHKGDNGRYSNDCSQNYEFDMNLIYNKEDSVLVLEYFGDENPLTLR